MKRIVFVEAPDAVGLVHRITGVFVELGLNIVTNDEYVAQKDRRFFMRSEVIGTADDQVIRVALRERLPLAETIWVLPERKKEIVVLATKESHCLGDLLLRQYAGELKANIRAVIANHDTLGSLVEKFGVPFVHVPHKGLTREAHERAMLAEINRFEPELLVLAKYMRVLSSDFVSAFPRRMVNIHHSFLPAFVGAQPYRQAWERGVKIIGATSHFVTDDLDAGPIIAQQVLPVDHTHSARDMALAGRDVEKNTLANALKLVFEDRVFVYQNRTIIFN